MKVNEAGEITDNLLDMPEQTNSRKCIVKTWRGFKTIATASCGNSWLPTNWKAILQNKNKFSTNTTITADLSNQFSWKTVLIEIFL